MTIHDYITDCARGAATTAMARAGAFQLDRSKDAARDAIIVARAVTADFERGGVNVNADLTEGYKAQIDKLVQKMQAKRTPLNERVLVPYTVKLGDHDKALDAMKDPDSKEPLLDVVLAKGRHALYNPATRVVHPIPLKGKAAAG